MRPEPRGPLDPHLRPSVPSFARTGRVQALLRTGRLEDAERALGPARDRVETGGTLAERVRVWGILARLSLEQGPHTEARGGASRALEQLRERRIGRWFFAPSVYAVAEVGGRLAADADPERRAAARGAARQSAAKAARRPGASGVRGRRAALRRGLGAVGK